MQKIEGKQTIQIYVLNQPHKLNRQDFLNFNQLVKAQQFNQMKIPFQRLDEEKTCVLNIFLYYIISIQRNFKTFKQDSYGDKYRSLCTKEISDYYIKNRMVIQLYEFSLLASQVLAMKIQQCAHIIYYLIYGRFASHPYINTVCGRQDYDVRNKMFKKGKQTLENVKGLNKKTFINGRSLAELQLDSFAKELRTVLKSQDIKAVRKKQAFDRNPVNRKQVERGQSLAVTQRKTLNKGSSLNTFVPQRITQGQNSSILQSLPFQRRSHLTSTDCNKKGLMRKQKFNQSFDINEYKVKIKMRKSPSNQNHQNKQNHGRNTKTSTNNESFQIGKINYENFKNISDQLRMKNVNFDKIRNQCVIRQNYMFSMGRHNVQNQMESYMKGSKTVKQQDDQGRAWNELKEKSQWQSVSLLNRYHLKRNFTFTEEIGQKDMSLTKNALIQPQRAFQIVSPQEQNQKQSQEMINLLRSNETIIKKQNQDTKKPQNSNQSSIGFNKTNCKHKLQKYKSEYRKFIKTQLLDRIIQAS